MKCPACSVEMVEENFGGAMIDACKNGCKGLWFDWSELEKLDEKHEGAGNALKEAIESPRVNDENRPKIKCPKCAYPMHIHKYKSSKEVNIDECYMCRGFFLDSGELGTIRDSFMSDADRDAYVSKLLTDMPEYQDAKADQVVIKQRTASLNKLTKLIRPSYYITGK